jgi:hypothetical protein
MSPRAKRPIKVVKARKPAASPKEDSAHGLQALGNRLHRAQSEPRARQILHGLHDAIAATLLGTPVRRRPYLLGDEAPAFTGSGEAAWARALWKEHGPGTTTSRLLPGICERLLGVRVNLHDTNRGAGGGEIDLLGVHRLNRLPVVIELKGSEEQGSLLRALVEATEYALALRKAWPHRLRADWLGALKAAGLGEPQLPVFLDGVTVVVAAPESYWITIEAPGGVPQGTWRAIDELARGLHRYGVDVVFASLTAESVDVDQPVGTRAEFHSLPR